MVKTDQTLVKPITCYCSFQTEINKLSKVFYKAGTNKHSRSKFSIFSINTEVKALFNVKLLNYSYNSNLEYINMQVHQISKIHNDISKESFAV